MTDKGKTIINRDNIDAATLALQFAKRCGADHADTAISNELGFSVTARQNDVETVEHHQGKGMTITIYMDHKVGSASTSDLTKSAIQAAVEKACAIARFSGQDEYSGLAEPNLLARNYPDLELYHHWAITPADAIQMAIECETIALKQDKRIIHSGGVTVSTLDQFHVYANSHGFLGYYPSSQHHIACSLVACEDDKMQRDYEYSVARKSDALDDIALIAKHTAQKTLRRLGASDVKTQEFPVIFHAPIAKGLLGTFIRAISGRNLYTKSTFLLNAMHEKIFPENINIYQQPHLLAALGSAPFDNEGVATHDRHYIKNGELVSYVLGSYSARKLGLQTTANAGGVFNLRISHSDLNLQKLFAKMGTGLFVTELMGQGINLLTGDYSRGAAGYWIANGEIQYPVERVTIAGNLRNMYAGIVAIGNDVDQRGNIQTGSILIDQMMVAGN